MNFGWMLLITVNSTPPLYTYLALLYKWNGICQFSSLNVDYKGQQFYMPTIRTWTKNAICLDSDQEPFNNKKKVDKFEMEMNGDENYDNRRCICNYPCSRCSSCSFSCSWNDSNLFFTLKRFINVTCNRKKRRRREINCKRKLSDYCGLISKTFKIVCMSFCQKMKVLWSPTKSHYAINNKPSSNAAYTFFLILLLSHQIR